jgi:hypothetical protein
MTRRYLLPLLALAGCASPPKVTPPIVTSVVIKFSWNQVQNGCLTPAEAPCEINLTLMDRTTGLVITQPAIGETSYLYTVDSSALGHTYGLAVTQLEENGTTISSPMALTVVVPK